MVRHASALTGVHPALPRPLPRLLPAAPLFTLALLVAPVVAGLLGAVLPAFGWFPPLGGTEPTLAPWFELLAAPGLWPALRLTVTVALASTVVSLGVALAILAATHGTRAEAWVERALAPLLAVPHAAAAMGLAFLIAPSGWVMRVLSPWATGLSVAPDWLIIGDPLGLSLVAGLVVKEVPFLLLMALAATGRAEATAGVLAARTLGYTPVAAWAKVVLPRLYPQLRLPILAVLAYSASVVDVALVLGPLAPPPLAVQITRWSTDPDLSRRFVAAAGAVLLASLTLALVLLWRVVEMLVGRLGRAWIDGGARHAGDRLVRISGMVCAVLLALVLAFGLAGLAVWSFAGLWTFPDAWPRSLSPASWTRAAPDLASAAFETALLGSATTVMALGLVLACLEAEHRHGLGSPARALWLLYLPLVVPQVAFLTGLQTLALVLGLDGARVPVVVAHLVFVTPYVYLTLAEPWRAWDTRAALAAAALGRGPDAVFWRVRLPMLLRPVLAAAAVGFAVSAGLYLPTLLLGGGRIATLTTETVALAAGGDRRLAGVMALAQTAAPLAGFALALAVPALLWRNRRGLR